MKTFSTVVVFNTPEARPLVLARLPAVAAGEEKGSGASRPIV